MHLLSSARRVSTGAPPATGSGSTGRPPEASGQNNAPAVELPAAHDAIVCVAMPGLVVSPPQGQLTGRGLEGVYHCGRRLLARCWLRVAGREPISVQGRKLGPSEATFTATLRMGVGPDPDISVERVRGADGTESITLRSFAPHPLRLPVEIFLATDLADLADLAAGRSGPDVTATVHAAGLRWSTATAHAVTTADPPPDDVLAPAGLLRWELRLAPGQACSIELRTGPGRRGAHLSVAPPASEPARAEGDDARIGTLLRTGVGDLRALMMRDVTQPSDAYLVAGAPWRCGLAPADSLWAARMTLPLGTALAASTLRTLARTQSTSKGEGFGLIPGPMRAAGLSLPPGSTGVEATLAFPTVLAEARRWGLPERDLADLLPAAERCLTWLRRAARDGLLWDPSSGPARCETQAHAHRAAVLGADLLAECGRPGSAELRERAAGMRERFRAAFWVDSRSGSRPAVALAPDGRPLGYLGAALAHLLDTGLLGGGRYAPGLLDKVSTEQVGRLLGSPSMDSGWGLRSVSSQEIGYNPFGHRAGAVRVYETAVAVTGLAAAGLEKEAGSLLKGLLDAAEYFEYRLPEMYAAAQRTAGSAPLPHPAACRPAAIAAGLPVQLLVVLAGLRPDAPAGTVRLDPMSSAPLGELRVSGLRVASEPFAARVSRLGMGMVEEASSSLQLGV
ncbi:glycogen debranching N-terminal domain-containing protein [Streptomyces sp. NPDC006879]|uniref:glycogen debranching N-terminal domain-containing protein n=1 Tax=Streptomyces sp. NPDC006879 TaxID=3364767 RepID=UPI0036AF10E1